MGQSRGQSGQVAQQQATLYETGRTIATDAGRQAARWDSCEKNSYAGYGESVMKPNRAYQSSVDVSNLSIPDAEEIIEEALAELGYSQDPGLVRALHFLAPPGYQAIVELCSESGRSKRRNASAEAWSPEEDEIRIYFERVDDEDAPARPTRTSAPVHEVHYEDDDGEEEMVLPADIASAIINIYKMSSGANVDEIVIKPAGGQI